MNNYDDYLLHQQYSYDSRELNDDRLWLLIEDGSFIAFSGGEEETKEAYYRAKEEEYTIVEYGWIWENDYDPMNFEATYRLFNIV